MLLGTEPETRPEWGCQCSLYTLSFATIIYSKAPQQLMLLSLSLCFFPVDAGDWWFPSAQNCRQAGSLTVSYNVLNHHPSFCSMLTPTLAPFAAVFESTFLQDEAAGYSLALHWYLLCCVSQYVFPLLSIFQNICWNLLFLSTILFSLWL